MTTTGFSGATVPVTQDVQTLQLWRAALLVYRRVNLGGYPMAAIQADHAAIGVVMHLRPELDWLEASRIVNEAVAAFSTRYTDWLWQTGKAGAPEPEWPEEV